MACILEHGSHYMIIVKEETGDWLIQSYWGAYYTECIRLDDVEEFLISIYRLKYHDDMDAWEHAYKLGVWNMYVHAPMYNPVLGSELDTLVKTSFWQENDCAEVLNFYFYKKDWRTAEELLSICNLYEHQIFLQIEVIIPLQLKMIEEEWEHFKRCFQV
jgi:hypothetical protein